MNTSLLIFLFVLLIVPAVYSFMRGLRVRKRRKREQLLAEAYEKLVFSKRLVVRLYNIIGNGVIALDADNKMLAGVDMRKKHVQQYCIPLRSITSTEVIETIDKDRKASSIHLRLNSDERQYEICFFDAATDPVTEAEQLKLRAQEWKMRIFDLQQQHRQVARRS